MNALDRFLVAAAALAAGSLIGLFLRHRRTLPRDSTSSPTVLPAGLVVVTAPYCTRCTSLLERLVSADIPFERLDVATGAKELRVLGITTAPTVLQVDAEGRIINCESRNFSDRRLSELAKPSV